MTISYRLLAGLALTSAVAFAQSANLPAVPATARIYKPITLTLTSTGLSFGDIFSDAVGGDVTINALSGARTTTGPILATTGIGNTANFTVGGKRNASYAITLPADGAITLTGAGAAMPVKTWRVSVAGGAPAPTGATGTLANVAAATQLFQVGATLTVGISQVDGDYAGTFPVTVTYN